LDFPIAIRLPFIGDITSGSKPKKSIQDVTKDKYKKAIAHITEREKGSKEQIFFGRATAEELKILEKLNLPPNIALFFVEHNPIRIVKLERVLLFPIEELYKKNNESKMGKIVNKYKYRIIAGTAGEDVYCINAQHSDMSGESPVYLITGNALNMDSLQNVREACYLVGTSFANFLEGL